ncbi:MAG: hypothetical protein CMJ76_11270 [Planctomycetaceae bacterium]|nr:hypothetical protein [Planctomycetaceae bacterium]
MNSTLLLISTALLGVDYIVEETNGVPVFVVQIEEELVSQLSDGFEINSIVPEKYERIRNIRIVIAGKRHNDVAEPFDRENSDPLSLNPDRSILPPDNELEISSTIKLLPDEFPLPNLARSDYALASQRSLIATPLASQGAANFDLSPAKQAGDTFHSNTEPIVSNVRFNDIAPITHQDSSIQVNDDAVDLNTTTSRNIAANSFGTTRHDEPELIHADNGQFVALPTKVPSLYAATEIQVPNDSPVNSQTDNPTSLLVLLFSVTLNLFLLGTYFIRLRR